MATITTKPCALRKQKPARLNPARRRAAKAKEAGLASPASEATCSNVQSVDPGLQAAKPPVSPNARAIRPAVSRQNNSRKTAACKQQDQPAPAVYTQSAAATQNMAKTNSLNNPAIVTGGLMGCAAGAVILLGAGLYSRVAGVDSVILTARTSKAVVNNLIEDTVTSLKAGTYNPPEALDMLRRTCLAYACALPGGAAWVEHLFHEIELIRRQRGAELDQTLVEACNELANARKRGATAVEMHTSVLKQLARLSAFTSRAAQDIVARNPGLSTYAPLSRKQKIPTVKINMVVRKQSTASAC